MSTFAVHLQHKSSFAHKIKDLFISPYLQARRNVYKIPDSLLRKGEGIPFHEKELAQQDTLGPDLQTEVEDPVEDAKQPEVTGIIGETSV